MKIELEFTETRNRVIDRHSLVEASCQSIVRSFDGLRAWLMRDRWFLKEELTTYPRLGLSSDRFQLRLDGIQQSARRLGKQKLRENNYENRIRFTAKKKSHTAKFFI